MINLNKALADELTVDHIIMRSYQLLKEEMAKDETKLREFTKLVNETSTMINEHFRSRGVPTFKGLVVLDCLLNSVCLAADKDVKGLMETILNDNAGSAKVA